MKGALFIAAIIGAACGILIPVPPLAVKQLQAYGGERLGSVITEQKLAFAEALAAFKPINASCMDSYEAAREGCGECVNEKCLARSKSACKPSDFEIILGNTINFFGKDVPDFVTDTIPDFFEDKVGGAFVDLGEEIVDLTGDVGDFFEDKVGGALVDLGGEIEGAATDVKDFFEDVGGAFEDLGEGVVDVVGDIGGGIENVVGEIGGAFEDLGEGALDIAGDIGGGIGSVAGNIGEGIGSVVGNIGDGLKDIFSFGRKKRSLRARRSTEPSCSALKDDATEACQFYLSPDYCADCGFSTAEAAGCRGYDTALQNLKDASADVAWMSKATSTGYQVVQVKFNPVAVDSTGSYEDVEVEVHIFGEDLAFTVDQAINPYIPTTAGPIIADQALDLFKSL